MTREALLPFLADGKNYDPPVDHVDVVETDLSWLFLAGQQVCLLKKPLRFDSVDLANPAAREKCYQRQLRYNRCLADNLYEKVVPLYCDDGHWSFSGCGEPAEYCVRMRRLPAVRMLSYLADHGADLYPVEPIAERLIAFYRNARATERTARAASPVALEAAVRPLVKVLGRELGDSPAFPRVESALLEFVVRHVELLQERCDEGKVRELHGDLRADHICVIEPPVVFGSADLTDRAHHVDILDDLAGLTVDLDEHGRPDWAADITERVLTALEEPRPDHLFEFYCAWRAAQRARLACLRSTPRNAQRARQLLQQASDYCRSFHTPTLLVMVGVMGTGKTTLAQALGNAMGIHRLATETLRKEMFNGKGPAVRFGLADPNKVQLLYDELLCRADQALTSGASVVLDGSFLTKESRAQAVDLARRHGITPLFLDCVLPRTDTIARLDQRLRKNRGTADTRPDQLDEQGRVFEPVTELPADQVLVVNTQFTVPQLVETVLEALARRDKLRETAHSGA